MLFLLKADPERFTILNPAKVSYEETWAHQTTVGDDLHIHELNGLNACCWMVE